MTTNNDTIQSYLTFKIGEESFAANVNRVIEILEIPRITKVPNSPEFMRGVINLRGSVLPIVDTKIKFGMPPIPDTINSCIVVLRILIDSEEVSLGAIVDSVTEVMEISFEEIQEAPKLGSKYNTKFIEGMVKEDNQFILILNMDNVFSDNETLLLKDSSLNSISE